MQNDPRELDETDEKRDLFEKNNWADDQKERGYYYDDAHGYEDYHPKAKNGSEDDTEGEMPEQASNDG